MSATLKRTVERLLATRSAGRIASVFSAPRDVILAYHNVVPDGEGGRGDRPLHVERSAFAAHLDELGELADVVPLGEMIRHAASLRGRPSHRARPRVAVTFDDAYRGAVTIASDELVRRGLPSTIFVAPGLLGDRSFWWDDVAFGPQGAAGLDAVRPVALEKLAGRVDVVRRWVIDVGHGLGRPPAAYRSATLDELREVASREGVTLAPHSWSHPNLEALLEAEIESELRRPLDWLRERFDEDRVLPWIAWPYGRSSDLACSVAAAVGYDAGLRIDGTWLPSPIVDPFRLPRLSVPSGLSRNGFRARIMGTWVRA